MSKEEKQRPRVHDINKCSTTASIAEYLEDNSTAEFIPRPYSTRKILEHALYKPTNLNFTQYQLKLQSIEALPKAYEVLLRIMEVRFSLDRLDL